MAKTLQGSVCFEAVRVRLAHFNYNHDFKQTRWFLQKFLVKEMVVSTDILSLKTTKIEANFDQNISVVFHLGPRGQCFP